RAWRCAIAAPWRRSSGRSSCRSPRPAILSECGDIGEECAPPCGEPPRAPAAASPRRRRYARGMDTLRFGSGAPGALLLHGYGADGHDLAPIAPMLPGTVIVPSAADATPYGGRQWWSLDDAKPLRAMSAADAVLEDHPDLARA